MRPFRGPINPELSALSRAEARAREVRCTCERSRSARARTAPTGSPAQPGAAPASPHRSGHRSQSANVWGANVAKRTGARVDAAQRDAQALELRAAGASFRVIADRLGVSVSTAWKCVDRGLAATRHEPSARLRVLERERLDRLTVEAVKVLQARHVAVSGGRIVRGDDGQPLVDHGPTLQAVNTLVRLMERRAKLEGLDAPARHQVDARVMTGDQMDDRIAELENLLAVDDPNWAATQRRQQERDALVERFRLKWSSPGQALRDPAGLAGEGLDLAIALLDLPADQKEAVELEVERVLLEVGP